MPATSPRRERFADLRYDRRLATPAFVFDMAGIEADAARISHVARIIGCRAHYSVKALSLRPVVALVARHLGGLSASSLAEARLCRSVLDTIGDRRRRTLQLTQPGLPPRHLAKIAALCDSVVFNSLSQWRRLAVAARDRGTQLALRVNPQQSLLDDARYDPCRPHSQLGVPLGDLAAAWQAGRAAFDKLRGIHFHTNHLAMDTGPIEATATRLADAIPALLDHVQWLNVGGGYRLAEMSDQQLEPLGRCAAVVRTRFGLEMLVEPGSALVRRHGYLVATVVDAFTSEGRSIAILDTSVAHLAEVFEYQRPPAVVGASARHAGTAGDARPVTLAGASCLAGDRFGEFCFDEPPVPGDRVVFRDVGAYALAKVQRFNGLAPPAVWLDDGYERTRVRNREVRCS